MKKLNLILMVASLAATSAAQAQTLPTANVFSDSFNEASGVSIEGSTPSNTGVLSPTITYSGSTGKWQGTGSNSAKITAAGNFGLATGSLNTNSIYDLSSFITTGSTASGGTPQNIGMSFDSTGSVVAEVQVTNTGLVNLLAFNASNVLSLVGSTQESSSGVHLDLELNTATGAVADYLVNSDNSLTLLNSTDSLTASQVSSLNMVELRNSTFGLTSPTVVPTGDTVANLQLAVTAAVPEPSSWALGLVALGSVFYLRRRALRA